jgi:tetratricopeptide (TPR) repeat protein
MSLPLSPPQAASGGGVTGDEGNREARIGHLADVAPGALASLPPLPVESVVADVSRAPEPSLTRYVGLRVDVLTAQTRLRDGARVGDGGAESRAAAALARLLVARGTELDLAIRLAERALELRADPELREELSAWCRGTGDWSRAILTLRPLVDTSPPARRARLRARVAVLLGYAGDAGGAAAELRAAEADEPQDPVAPELLGCMGGWAKDTVTPAEAARAFLEGARRRASGGDSAAAFEDILRAFEMAPEHAPAAEELRTVLESRGRPDAADEIRREHARALGDRARSIHVSAIEPAVQAGEWARALGAAFDAGLDAELDLEGALRALGIQPATQATAGFDELVERVGLYGLLQARLETMADTSEDVARSRAYLGLGQLWAGPLSDLDRALEAWVESLVADPTSGEALAQLRMGLPGASDQTPLVEALTLVGARVLEDPKPLGLPCLPILTTPTGQN